MHLAQDVYLGFKLFDLGLFLQPRRKLPLRLGFYNATFGVWEQWAVSSGTNRCYSSSQFNL